jgi:hypothetical protein
MARIDVPSLSFLFRLNVALFAAMGLGLALAFHFWIPPFFLRGLSPSTAFDAREYEHVFSWVQEPTIVFLGGRVERSMQNRLKHPERSADL